MPTPPTQLEEQKPSIASRPQAPVTPATAPSIAQNKKARTRPNPAIAILEQGMRMRDKLSQDETDVAKRKIDVEEARLELENRKFEAMVKSEDQERALKRAKLAVESKTAETQRRIDEMQAAMSIADRRMATFGQFADDDPSSSLTAAQLSDCTTSI
ncbi:hypothetical protein BCR44DRAFT_33883 [Catenaria anguillulae PL171]|uniref:Uncharacterized protein n=1 Tax=Catenaria anguillulae PL171 TaxID=765915 RepID=A0A1Y2HNB5_9FUNG|nr:hypothetical protein BCR44DRAFT_33883 [Catenaria anguillulae PL171]